MKINKVLLVGSLLFILGVAGCNGGGYQNKKTGGVAAGQVKEFDVIISGYTYSPPSITVSPGSTVFLTITNKDPTTHGFSLAKFGVQESIRAGETKTIQFTATEEGGASTFCSTQHGEKLLIRVR